MRALILLTGLMTVGCAGEPTQAPPNALSTQAPVGSSASGANTGVTSSDIEKQRLAAAKNLNLKVTTKDGERLYCRSNLMTGSHIQTDTRCFTAEQLDVMEQGTQRDLDIFLNRSEALRPPVLPGSK